MKKNIILSLAKKEFFGYINSALAYTVLVPFLLLSIFIYTRTALIGGEASLRPYFELLPWFLLLLAPALSMKLLTDEHRQETLELLFAHPISEAEIVLGKFFGVLAFFIVILLTTIGLPLTLLAYSRPDIGQILGQYIGALFIGSTFLSIGIAASAYVKNAISSFLLGASISFVFIIIGLEFVTQMLPFPFNRIAAELSVLTHGENIARGLLDIRDVFYFLTLTGLFLAIAIIKLSERKTTENATEKRKLHIALGLIAAIGIVMNVLLSFYPVRLDLTQSRIFTLSEGTKQTLKNLPDIVTITLYSSQELPAQMQLVAREITDLLKDYERLSRNVNVKIVSTKAESEATGEAQSAGMREIQFNSVGSGKFAVQSGILGIAIRYADKTESIPFISDTSDLEYQLTRRIRKLTNEKEQIVGILKTGFTQNQILDELLATQYKTEPIKEDDTEKLKNIRSLIVIDDGSEESTASALIKNYLDQNGRVLYLANGVSVNQQSLSAVSSKSNSSLFLKDYGVTLNNDLVYDLQLAETLSFTGQGGERFFAPYPYWLRALPESTEFTPLETTKSISLGWPSSLTLETKGGITQKKLLMTSVDAGRIQDNYNISPQAVSTLRPNTKEKILLSVALEKGDTRLVVVGSTSISEDRFMQNNRDNVVFLSNTIDYLVADRDLAAIPSKSSGIAVFEFNSQTDVLLVQYGNLLTPPILVIGFAVYYLRRRKLRTQRQYVK